MWEPSICQVWCLIASEQLVLANSWSGNMYREDAPNHFFDLGSFMYSMSIQSVHMCSMSFSHQH